MRDDAVGLSYNALSCILKNSKERLINKLIDSKAVNQKTAESTGIDTSTSYYKLIDVGDIGNIKPIQLDITIDKTREKLFQNTQKSIGIKVLADSLSDSAKGFTKTGRTQVFGQISAEYIKNKITEIQNDSRLVPYSSNLNDGGYLEQYSGFGNDTLFVVFDDYNQPLGYTVIHYLGFNNPPEYQDITYRYENVDFGNVNGITSTNAVQILRSSGFCKLHVDKSKLPDEMKSFSKISMLTLFGVIDIEKTIQDKEFITGCIKKGSGGQEYYDDYNKMFMFSPTQIMIAELYDSSGIPLGYCVFKILY